MRRLCTLIFLLTTTAMAEEIRTIDGTTYRKARVTQVDPDGVIISHEKGVVKVEFTQLPPETRQRFGYDERKASIYCRNLATRATESAEEKRRLLKEYEERELARIQKQMESGASGDELVYGSKGAGANRAGPLVELRKKMEAGEDARIAREREPVTIWNSPQPAAKVFRTVLKGLGIGMGQGGGIETSNAGHACDGGYFPAISHLQRSDVPPAKKSP